MKSEEAIEIIIKGENAPRSLAADAQEMAIEALKNQAKYERALRLVGDFIRSQDTCPVENCKICGSDDSGEPACYGNGCNADLADYFKRKAGFGENYK